MIGKKCYITDKESIYYGEWGIIRDFDGEYYHVAIADGGNSYPVFTRNEIRIPRDNNSSHP
jgi:hypothetical protein